MFFIYKSNNIFLVIININFLYMEQGSVDLYGQQEQPKRLEQGIQHYLRDLERGDLLFSKPIQYGYILVGQKSIGKTSVGHLLSGNTLEGVYANGQYCIQRINEKYKNAKINHSYISQTGIPNAFLVDKYLNIPNENSYVIDIQSYYFGIMQLLSNRHINYKMYSKVQNIKFILCFEPYHIRNKARQLIETIDSFTKIFSNYQNNRHQIWKSCVFLFNKVDETQNKQTLKQQLKKYNQKSLKHQKKQQQIDLIKQFIRYIVDNDRVLTIKRYYPGELAKREDLLKVIDQKTRWWKRQFNPQKEEVDLSPISINITQQILILIVKNQMYYQPFTELIRYYNKRINQIFYDHQDSLYSVLNQLVNDAMGPCNSHNFLSTMQRYVDKYYHIYDPEHQQQRDKVKKQLFLTPQALTSVNQSNQSKLTKIKNANYTLKKFNCLEYIQKIKSYQRQIRLHQPERTEQQNSQLVSGFYNIIKQLQNVSYSLKNGSQIISKYVYIIYRVFSQIQFLNKVIKCGEYGNDHVCSNKIQKAVGGQFLTPLYLPLIHFMDHSYCYNGYQQIQLDQIKQKYIREVDINSDQFRDMSLNWQCIDLFSSISPDDPGVVKKVAILFDRFSQQVFLEQSMLMGEQNKQNIIMLIQRLTDARLNLQQQYQLAYWQDHNVRFQIFFLLRSITDKIGKLLIIIKEYKLARKVYNSIMYIDKVCILFEQQIRSLKVQKSEQNEHFRLRIQYAKYLKDHGRLKQQTTSISVLQQAFQLVTNKTQLQEVMTQYNEFLSKMDYINQQFTQKIYQRRLFKNFQQELINELQNLRIKQQQIN